MNRWEFTERASSASQGTSTTSTPAARSYVHAVVTLPDGAAAVHAYGHYVDDLVESAGSWKIARRHFTTVTTELHPAMR